VTGSIPIVHTSARCVVVDKPSGLLSVPGIGPEKADCVISRVKAMFPGATGPMMVHRLDMETSGLLVVALDAEAQRDLSLQFERRSVHKRYTAVLRGVVQLDSGEIDLPMRLDVDHRPYQIVDFEQGRPAHTRFRVLERGATRTLVEFEPTTGRTHQLRVHAAYSGKPEWRQGVRSVARVPENPAARVGLGCPIVGDELYGEREGSRLMLHAGVLEFDEPGGERLRVESPAGWTGDVR